MARIRTIKPEISAHEGLFDLEKETGLPLRFAWCMLFTVADRDGRFPWRPRTLKAAVLPHDEVDFNTVLAAFEGGGYIVRYEVDGDVYGCIPTWKLHQAVNTREAASKIPPPPDAVLKAARARTLPTVHTPRGVNVPSELREMVLSRDGHKCLRCGAAEDLTIDHIFPQTIGGTHAITNLRTLCRSCNSARPVHGEALINDLARDAYTLEDMQRICMHVHAQGERKGKEGEKPRVNGASKFEPPAWIPEDAWQAFEEHRKKKRSPMTDRARELIVIELEKLDPAHANARALLEQSIRRGWLDVFPLKGGHEPDQKRMVM